MTVELEIRDGDPWWLSPDVWVVPGDDPLGESGTPIAGIPAFMWARVRNHGATPATNAEVKFYWADPSTAFDRNTANFVGSAFVTLDPDEVSEVLLLTPWIPEFVNNGHECILAEAFHNPLDPLPVSPAFNVPTDRHVAQRNLSVVQANQMGFFFLPIVQMNTSRQKAEFRLVADIAALDQLKPLIKPMRLQLDPSAEPGLVKRLGFVSKRCPQHEDLKSRSKPNLTFTLEGASKVQRNLVGQISGGPALIHIKQYHGNRLIGGQSVLVIPGESAPKGKKKTATKLRKEVAS